MFCLWWYISHKLRYSKTEDFASWNTPYPPEDERWAAWLSARKPVQTTPLMSHKQCGMNIRMCIDCICWCGGNSVGRKCCLPTLSYYCHMATHDNARVPPLYIFAYIDIDNDASFWPYPFDAAIHQSRASFQELWIAWKTNGFIALLKMCWLLLFLSASVISVTYQCCWVHLNTLRFQLMNFLFTRGQPEREHWLNCDVWKIW